MWLALSIKTRRWVIKRYQLHSAVQQHHPNNMQILVIAALMTVAACQTPYYRPSYSPCPEYPEYKPDYPLAPSNKPEYQQVPVYKPVYPAPAYKPEYLIPAYTPDYLVEAYKPNYLRPAYKPTHSEHKPAHPEYNKPVYHEPTYPYQAPAYKPSYTELAYTPSYNFDET